MSLEEFNNEFDILYNNAMSNAAPGLDGYEKSVFLTKAQLEVLKNYFNPQGNKYGLGFDGSPKRLIDFSRIVKVTECTKSSEIVTKIDERSLVFNLPPDVLFIVTESVHLSNNKIAQAVPIPFADYSFLMRKPFKFPHKSEVWRLLTGANSVTSLVELISPKEIERYVIRYVKKVRPIILIDLKELGLSIDGYDTMTESEVGSELHDEFLLRAVELAKSAYIGDLNTTVQLGQRTE